MKASVLTFILLTLFSFLHAQTDTSPNARLLLEGGIEFGGDEVLEVLFTNGESQNMTAGQGGYVAVGGQFQFSNIEKLLFRTSLGFKYVTTAAENANIRLTRFPVNVMAYWKIVDELRAGVGATTHLGVRFKGDDFVPDANFTSSLGPRFELGYKWIALTYTTLNYTATTGEQLSANSIGISVSVAIPEK